MEYDEIAYNLGLDKDKVRIIHHRFITKMRNPAIKYILIHDETIASKKYAKDINKLPLVIATPDVLNHFEELVVPMFDSIELHEKESSRLSTLRDTLLPKLMSGAIKV